ncbi:EF-1 guanine nucleotide exchange domain-containing protein, partial [Toxoplasma gondii ARI]
MVTAFATSDELATPCTYYTLTWGDAAAAPKKAAVDDDDFDLF